MKIINSRYQLLGKLGEGGSGVTYKAKDLQTDHQVALKVISLRQISDWKTIDLFEREGRVLKQLDHPAIPSYIDSFQVDGKSDRLFCLVQEFAPGKSLAQWVKEGWQPDESEVKAIASQLLNILVYLQQFTPPIFHRDIKPQNVLRNQDGNIYLVDFGAVQDTYRQTITGGSTVVGTFGYMAPEQYRGQASLGTDLYGLGTTLLFLLTGKDPIDLPQNDDLTLKIPEDIRLSRSTKQWIERLIDPVVESRLSSAQVALNALDGDAPEPSSSSYPQRPPNTQIEFLKTDTYLQFYFSAFSLFPPSQHLPQFIRTHQKLLGLITLVAVWLLWLIGLLLLAWFFTISGITLNSTNWVPERSVLQIFIILFTAMFSVLILPIALRTLSFSTSFFIDTDFMDIEGFPVKEMPSQLFKVKLENIQDIQIKDFWDGKHILITTYSRRKIHWGHLLSEAEQRWLTSEIQSFMQVIQDKEEQQQVWLEKTTHNQHLNAVQYLLGQGLQRYHQSKFEQGRSLFQSATILDETCVEGDNNLGVVLFRQEQYEDAIASFKTAIQKAPGYRVARVNLAIAYDTVGEQDHWLQIYTTVDYPNTSRGKDEQTLILVNHYPDSLAKTLRILKVHIDEMLDSNAPLEALRWQKQYAYLLLLQGNPEAAMTIYTDILSSNYRKHKKVRSLMADVHFDYGWALAMQGDIQAALTHWQMIPLIGSQTDTTTKVKALLDYYQHQTSETSLNLARSI